MTFKTSISGNFTEVAAYDIDKGNPLPLVSYLAALKSLTEPGKDQFKTSDLLSYIDPPSTREIGPYRMLTGEHVSRLRVGFIAAEGDQGRPVYMPAIFDGHMNTAVVIGPSGLPVDLAGALKNAGVTYVDKNDANAPAHVDEFLKVSMAGNNNARSLTEDIIRAAAICANLPVIQNYNGQRVIPKNATPGGALVGVARSQEVPALFVAAAKNPPQIKS